MDKTEASYLYKQLNQRDKSTTIELSELNYAIKRILFVVVKR